MSQSLQRQRSQNDYAIACICPMGIELAAVEGMLDEIHHTLPLSRDQNAYTLGKIGIHNIVVAVMPATGNNVAAAVITQLLNDFHSIRFGLLVGIGGGVPGTVDVRLGDVVVSQATDVFGGVVQYDIGKRIDGGHFKRTGLLNKPPQVVSASVRKLESQHRRNGHQLLQHISEMLDRWPRMRDTYRYPIEARDDLFHSSYSHVSGLACLNCDRRQVIPRQERTDREPVIHYGTIGSANIVVKDAVLRDELREEMNLLCVEMEAAGLTNDFPCLVIRGICDYADSHKNSEWQPFAAAVAAAYMKELLLIIPAQAGVCVSNVMGRISRGNQSIETSKNTAEFEAVDRDILASLAFPQMKNRQLDIQMRPPHVNTCQWILNSDAYKKWDAQLHGLLWIKGKPGAGKSTIMSFLYTSKLRHSRKDADVWLEFFYSAKGTQLQRTFVGMLRSMLHQLLQLAPQCRVEARNYYQEKCLSFGEGAAGWEWHEQELQSLSLKSIVLAARYHRVLIFVDALDEAGEAAAQAVAEYFHKLNQQSAAASLPIKICMSCRHYPIVPKGWGTEVYVEDHNYADIATYVYDHLSHACKNTADGNTDLEQWRPLQAHLVQRAGGVFQWICLAMSIVEKSILDGAIPEEVWLDIQELPEEISEMYKHILLNVINPRSRTQSFLLFQWTCLAEEPLTVKQMRYAIAASKIVPPFGNYPSIRCDKTAGFVQTDEVMKLRIRAQSGGLLEVTNDRVQVCHQTVREFLMQQGLKLLAPSSFMKGSEQVVEQSDLSGTSEVEKIIFRCQSSLYWSCLKYLAVEVDMVDTNAEHASDKWLRQRRMISDELPFIIYATKNVFVHAEKAGIFRDHSVANQIELMNRAMILWIFLYQTFGVLSPKCPSNGTKPLHIAAGAGLCDLITHLLDKGETVDVQDNMGYTALHHAVRWGHEQAAGSLIRAGANVNQQTYLFLTPLTIAATNGHLNVIRLLLEHGADLKDGSGKGQDALRIATQNGHVQAVLVFLASGADVNAYGDEYGNVLQVAAIQGNERVVQILLGAGANVNARGGPHGSALLAAVDNGNEKVVQILLKAGAKIDARGGEHGNALHAAVTRGNDRLVHILLEAGIDVNIQGEHCRNALQKAAWYCNLRLVRRLLEAGADVNAQGGEYGTALQAASLVGNEEVVQTLLEAGANVNLQGGRFGNALASAAYAGHSKIVRMLLDAGADVNRLSGTYISALNAASFHMSKDHKNITLMLKEAGANDLPEE